MWQKRQLDAQLNVFTKLLATYFDCDLDAMLVVFFSEDSWYFVHMYKTNSFCFSYNGTTLVLLW